MTMKSQIDTSLTTALRATDQATDHYPDGPTMEKAAEAQRIVQHLLEGESLQVGLTRTKAAYAARRVSDLCLGVARQIIGATGEKPWIEAGRSWEFVAQAIESAT